LDVCFGFGIYFGKEKAKVNALEINMDEGNMDAL
jgi:hypothetical protein